MNGIVIQFLIYKSFVHTHFQIQRQILYPKKFFSNFPPMQARLSPFHSLVSLGLKSVSTTDRLHHLHHSDSSAQKNLGNH